LIKQRRLTVGGTIIELVSEDPSRTAFLVQNVGDYTTWIYARKEAPTGSIWLFPHCWLYFEKDDDADKQWWIISDGGTSYVHVIEFYRKPPGWLW